MAAKESKKGEGQQKERSFTRKGVICSKNGRSKRFRELGMHHA
jgi:hypothetical protein